MCVRAAVGCEPATAVAVMTSPHHGCIDLVLLRRLPAASTPRPAAPPSPAVCVSVGSHQASSSTTCLFPSVYVCVCVRGCECVSLSFSVGDFGLEQLSRHVLRNGALKFLLGARPLGIGYAAAFTQSSFRSRRVCWMTGMEATLTMRR